MNYESVAVVESRLAPGVTFAVERMSFGRRMELMRRIRDLARRAEFLEAGGKPGERMEAALLKSEIDRQFLLWGLRGISGLQVDGADATPESLAERGPEDLCREALAAVRQETGLDEAQRKN